jgi:acyl carrier protein
MPRSVVISSLVFTAAIAIVGCGSSSTGQSRVIDKIQQEVAKILKKDAAQIDVRKPLGVEGADELDVVEIVMEVEEAFDVSIPDSALGDKPGEIAKTLTVQKLADIVAREMEKQKTATRSRAKGE